MKVVLVLFIQLLWLVVACCIGGYVSMSIFDSMLWRCLFGGIFSMIMYYLMFVFTEWVKAMKDPDVLAASDLRMSVKRYRVYQRIYDEYQAFMIEHGTDSPASERKFRELFKEVKNPNEWRRYQQYRYNLYKNGNSVRIMPINVGEKLKVRMEDGGYVIGTIQHDNQNNTFDVSFPFPVSIIPAKEPAEGWKDNYFPSELITLNRSEIDGIIKGKYVGTENHYHF